MIQLTEWQQKLTDKGLTRPCPGSRWKGAVILLLLDSFHIFFLRLLVSIWFAPLDRGTAIIRFDCFIVRVPITVLLSYYTTTIRDVQWNRTADVQLITPSGIVEILFAIWRCDTDRCRCRVVVVVVVHSGSLDRSVSRSLRSCHISSVRYPRSYVHKKGRGVV